MRNVAIADDSPAFLAAAASYVATHSRVHARRHRQHRAAGARRWSSPRRPTCCSSISASVPKRGLQLVQQVKSAPAAPASSRSPLRYAGSARRCQARRCRRARRQGELHFESFPGAGAAFSSRFINTVISFSAWRSPFCAPPRCRAGTPSSASCALPLVRERAPERLPGRGVERIAFHRVAQILRSARSVSPALAYSSPSE